MQRICPFLAIDDDGRTVVDGFHPDHRCRAVEPSLSLGRAQQVRTCLDISHASCERHVAAIAARGPAAWPQPAADATFAQTRLIVDPLHAGRFGSIEARPLPGARWVVGGVLGTVGVAAVVSGLAGGLGMAAAERNVSDSTPSAAATPAAAVVPPIGTVNSAPPVTTRPTPTPGPTPAFTSVPTEAPASAAPSATPRTYVVQTGDTLNAIAIRFGTSVRALQDANGLSGSDVILVGQVLIIP